MDPNSIVKLHLERNLHSQDQWNSFTSHRDQITEVIRGLLSKARRHQPNESRSLSLLVLGVGNGNDLDLAAIGNAYESITLVDLDEGAVRRFVARMPQDIQDRIHVLAPFDVSGCLSKLTPSGPKTDQELEELINRARRAECSRLVPCDHVLSTCLLSQMIDSVHQLIDGSHSRYLDLILAIRDGHLGLLNRLTLPGGKSVLITDIVSSDTLPILSIVADNDLTQTLTDAIQQQNFFTGLNPAVLIRKMSAPANVSETETQLHPPWRWNLGPRVFAVVAVETTPT